MSDKMWPNTKCQLLSLLKASCEINQWNRFYPLFMCDLCVLLEMLFGHFEWRGPGLHLISTLLNTNPAGNDFSLCVSPAINTLLWQPRKMSMGYMRLKKYRVFHLVLDLCRVDFDFFCQIPVCPSRIGHTWEKTNSRSSHPRSRTIWDTL